MNARGATCGVCGDPIEPHVRFHYRADGSKHYVDGPPAERPAEDAWQSAPHRARPRGWKRPPGATEATLLLRPCVKLLELAGFDVYSTEQGYRDGPGGSRVTAGVPDIYFRGRGWRGWVEAKLWDYKQTDAQTLFEAGELANGGVYLFIREVEQLDEWITLYGRSRT